MCIEIIHLLLLSFRRNLWTVIFICCCCCCLCCCCCGCCCCCLCCCCCCHLGGAIEPQHSPHLPPRPQHSTPKVSPFRPTTESKCDVIIRRDVINGRIDDNILECPGEYRSDSRAVVTVVRCSTGCTTTECCHYCLSVATATATVAIWTPTGIVLLLLLLL